MNYRSLTRMELTLTPIITVAIMPTSPAPPPQWDERSFVSHYAAFTVRKQQGAALITSLMFLVVMTLLVISAMSGNIMEERMAGNSRDRNVAFQAAEAALRDAMRDIQSARISGNTGFDASCTNGLCLPQTDGTPIWVDLRSNTAWTNGSSGTPSVAYGSQTGAATLSGVAAQPRYVIEVLETSGTVGGSLTLGFSATQPNYAYRATARGYGNAVGSDGAPTSQVTLQAVYVK